MPDLGSNPNPNTSRGNMAYAEKAMQGEMNRKCKGCDNMIHTDFADNYGDYCSTYCQYKNRKREAQS